MPQAVQVTESIDQVRYLTEIILQQSSAVAGIIGNCFIAFLLCACNQECQA